MIYYRTQRVLFFTNVVFLFKLLMIDESDYISSKIQSEL